MLEEKKVAIVYDWFDKWGGVERVLLTLHEMFPQAEFYTSYFHKKKANWAKDFNIKTSFIQKLPSIVKESRILSLPFYPYAFESFNFTGYDLVISVTSSFAKSIITRPETLHICYLLTPARYLWLSSEPYLKSGLSRLVAKPFISSLKSWDEAAAFRPDKIISISNTVSLRCKKYYKRDSEVIYPPFDVEYWKEIISKLNPLAGGQNSNLHLKSKNYYLIVSRLEPYKRIDLAINVFNKLPDLNLLIVGEGGEMKRLKRISNKNIHFTGYITDEELASCYTHAEGLIMPQEEDFGYVAVEAQFFGCPVISYNKGGASETVINEKTGIFFQDQTENSLFNVIERFQTISYNLKDTTVKLGKDQADKFSKEIFKDKFELFVKNSLNSYL